MKAIALTEKYVSNPLFVAVQHIVSFQWQVKGKVSLVYLADGREYFVTETPAEIADKMAGAAKSIAELSARVGIKLMKEAQSGE